MRAKSYHQQLNCITNARHEEAVDIAVIFLISVLIAIYVPQLLYTLYSGRFWHIEMQTIATIIAIYAALQSNCMILRIRNELKRQMIIYCMHINDSVYNDEKIRRVCGRERESVRVCVCVATDLVKQLAKGVNVIRIAVS